jgi:hypothetical protein
MLEPPPAASEAEILYDEDDPPAATAVPEVEEPEAPPEEEEPEAPLEDGEPEEEEPETEGDDEPVPAAEEPEPEPEAVAEHAEGDLRIPDGYSVPRVRRAAPDGRDRHQSVQRRSRTACSTLRSLRSRRRDRDAARDAGPGRVRAPDRRYGAGQDTALWWRSARIR